jgi:hypothetical protein
MLEKKAAIICDTEQIGALTVFLCSEAAAQIRGAALQVGGSWTTQWPEVEPS